MPDISNLIIKIDSNGVVQATGNFGKFVEASEKARKSATSLEKSAAGIGKEFAAFQLIAGRLPGPLKDIASGMMGLVSPATAAVGAVIGLTGAAVNFAKGSLEAFGEYEMIKTNLELVMGSAEAAAMTFSELRDLAAKTPFSLPGVSQAASMLRQAGIAAGDLVSTIEMLGNVSGGNMERFNRIAYNYTQVLQKGIMDARDTREFAGNLVPINKALQEMGVTGQATADDMVEAFRRMTQEGGMFFNAINRQGETLIGKTEQLNEAWKEFKATVADSTGLGEAYKGILSQLAEIIKLQTTYMRLRHEIGSDKEKINDGDKSIETQIRLLKNRNEIANAEIEGHIKRMASYDNDPTGQLDAQLYKLISGGRISGLQKEIDNNNRIISQYQEQINLIEKRKAAEQSWRDALDKSSQDYLTLQSKIKESYAKTEEGQKKVLLAEIALWKERLEATRIVEMEMPWSNGLKIAQTVGLPEEEKAQIRAILEWYQKQLEKGSGNLKSELDLWKKILMDNTGFTEKQMENMWAGISGEGKSLPVIEQFEKVMNMRRDVQFSLFGDDIDSQIRVAEETVNVYRKLYEDMFTVTLDKNGNIITVWKESEEAAKEAERAWRNAVGVLDNINFEKYISDLEKAAQLPFMSANDRVRADTRDKLKATGISSPSSDQIDQAISAQDTVVTNEYEKQLDIQKQLLSGKMSAKEYAIRQLQIEHGITEEAARRVYEYQKQAEAIKVLQNVLNDLRESAFREGVSGLIDMAHELGQAFQDGAISADEASDAFGNYIKRIIDALPQLLLSAGLQIMATNWKLGLAFIAASGLASFVSGVVSDTEKDGTEDQLAKLQRLQDEISKLIDQQKSLEEYYFKKRQELNAREAMRVNDLIVTPQGSFSTHPDDFIIASKHPETLGSGGGIKMNVNIVNNAGAVVTAQQRIGTDGINELLVAVDQRMQNNIASGRWDNSFAARDARIRGRNIKTS
jgi:tellurite resistance protein